MRAPTTRAEQESKFQSQKWEVMITGSQKARSAKTNSQTNVQRGQKMSIDSLGKHLAMK